MLQVLVLLEATIWLAKWKMYHKYLCSYTRNTLACWLVMELGVVS